MREYIYDDAGNLTRERDPLGFVTEYSYDDLSRLIEKVSPRGGKSSFSYDTDGNLLSETDAEGGKTSYTYSLSGDLLTKALPGGLKESYTYDNTGRVVEARDSSGQSLTLGYDAKGNVVRETDEDGNETLYAYDIMHRLTQSTDAKGVKTGYEYDDRGNLVRRTLPGGGEATFAYDVLDRMIEGKKDLTAAAVYTYDEMGRVTQVAQGDHVWKTEYDGNGNVLVSTDPAGATVSYTYDAMDRPVSVTDPAGNVTSIEYDALGRALKAIDPIGAVRSFAYDAEGNVTEETDVLGNKSSYSYDNLGRLTGVADALGRKAAYTYDEAGNITSKTVSGESIMPSTMVPSADRATRYEYDLHGNMTKTISPSGKEEGYAYDSKSRLTSMTKPSGNRISYDYDELGMLIQKSYSGSGQENVSYSYDEAGRRVEMSDDSGLTSYTWDEAGHLTSAGSTAENTLSYAYDEYGRVSEVGYPDGRGVSYAYDAADRLLSVTDSENGKTEYTYDENGNVLTCMRESGVITEYVYDVKDRLVFLANTFEGETLSSFAYTYDAMGHILTEVSEKEGILLKRAFEYDEAGELTGCTEDADGETAVYSYSYNTHGDRTVAVSGKKNYHVSYTYDDDGRLVRSHNEDTGLTIDYEWDEDGNLTLKSEEMNSKAIGLFKEGDTAEFTYSYDAEDRLKAVREGGSLLMAASYDGDGNRIFQVHRTLVPFGIEKAGLSESSFEGSVPEKGDAADVDGPVLNDEAFQADERDRGVYEEGGSTEDVPLSPYAYTYYEKVYKDPGDTVFWYGFGKGLVHLSNFLHQSMSVFLGRKYSDEWQEYHDRYKLEVRGDISDEFSDEDLEMLANTELSEKDIYDITNPVGLPAGLTGVKGKEGDSGHAAPELPMEGKEKPEAGERDGQAEMPDAEDGPIFIPGFPGEDMRIDYELTYYVNDISMENAQVAMEYGKRGEVKNVYTYGTERATADRVDGTTDTYLYDGRGSVAQIAEGNSITQSLSYGPFGEVTSGANGNDLIFGYNAEEYSPVTGLQYLRARYYAPDAASFITEDSLQGRLAGITSQNRYAYGENDPVNNADPSGHAIGNSAYERQMEAAGGINEIYNFYVGTALQNAQAQATNAFYGQLNRSQNVSYTDISAINSISLISQGTANAYINRGADAAYAVGATYGCTPGTLTNMAVNSFAANVNATKNSVNSKIASVKATKVNQYRAYQAYLAEQARVRAAQERMRVELARASALARSQGRVDRWRSTIRDNAPKLKEYDPSQMSLWNKVFYSSIGVALTPQVATAFLNFEKEDDAYIYHPRQNALQGAFGYVDMYDKIANVFTDIASEEYRFISGNNEYSLRVWKGNYLNIGAGAEAALYYRDTARPNMVWNEIQAYYPGDGWKENTMFKKVDEDYWMESEITLKYGSSTIFTYNPDDPKWWPGGFNPAYPGVRSDDLSATYNLGFSDNPSLYYAFLDQYKNKYTEDIHLSFDDNSHTATIRWG